MFLIPKQAESLMIDVFKKYKAYCDNGVISTTDYVNKKNQPFILFRKRTKR